MAVERIFPAAPIIGRGGIILSPIQFLFTGEDALRVTCISLVAVTIRIAGRFLQSGKERAEAFLHTLVVPGTGQVVRDDFQIGTGTVLNLHVIAVSSGLIQPGLCYVRADVIRGFTGATSILGTLIAGLVGSWGGRAWPGTALELPGEGPGAVGALQSATPAAGVNPELTLTVPTRVRVMSVTAVLTTSATAANRIPSLSLVQDGTVVTGIIESPLVQIASTTFRHSWIAGVAPSAPTGSAAIAQLPSPFMMRSQVLGLTAILRITTDGLQAGDQWTAISAQVEQWVDPDELFSI